MSKTITYTIPDEKLEEFKRGFLKKCPVPEGEPIMSENDWIKEWGRQQFIKAYRRGKSVIAEEQAILEEDLIT